jgi:hypothetical protein
MFKSEDIYRLIVDGQNNYRGYGLNDLGIKFLKDYRG